MRYLKIRFSDSQACVQQIDNQAISHEQHFSLEGQDCDAMLRQLGAEICRAFDAFCGAVVIGSETSRYSSSVIRFNGELADARLLLTDTLNVPVLSGEAPEELPALAKQFAEQREHSSWTLEYYGYQGGKKERSKESMLTVGNGYLGVRGALTESKASDDNYPGTYVASAYNKLVTRIAERDVVNEDFVNLPNAQFITLKVEGASAYCPNQHQVLELKRELDLKTSQLTTRLIGEDDQQNRFEILVKKVADMENPHHYGISYTVTPLNFSKPITLISEIDGQIINYGVERYRSLSSKHLTPVSEECDGCLSTLVMKTNQSGIEIAQSAALTFSGPQAAKWHNRCETAKTRTEIRFDASQDQSYTLEKTVALYTSLETQEDLPAKARALAARGSFPSLPRVQPLPGTPCGTRSISRSKAICSHRS
ncbi:glycoside hydrolase family 65 protein [Dongshaea marina]|uniref:hypothetical protein n=1 Tax=Dongshaea marina TaxID=2047966 RepID=UPI000D3E154B|nr:hypothetical protein [Dongshaea marina]